MHPLLQSNLHSFFTYEIKFIANLTRPWLVTRRPCLPTCLFDMFLFPMMSLFNCDNCWLTRFTVADTFWLSQCLVGIDKMTLQFCDFSLINCFSANRSFTICWWEFVKNLLGLGVQIFPPKLVVNNDTCP